MKLSRINAKRYFLISRFVFTLCASFYHIYTL